jgi:hypothetical protein
MTVNRQVAGGHLAAGNVNEGDVFKHTTVPIAD